MLLQNDSYPSDGRVLCEATALTDAGYEVTVICPRAPGQPWRERVSGVHLVRFPTVASRGGTGGFVLEYLIAAVALAVLAMEALIRGRFDVVHCHNPPDFLVPLAAIFKPFGVRLVFDQHDLAPELFSARFADRASSVVRRVLERLEALSWRLADLVIASNDSQRLTGQSRSGQAGRQWAVVRNGPDWRILEEEGVPPATLPHGGAMVGYGGVIGPQDGVEHLVRAFAHLVALPGMNDVHCVIVGDGDAAPDVRREAHERGLDGRISFPGWVSYPELVGWMAACDVCVAPEASNPYNDTCTSIKVMEYMALGKPIVAFDLPEHRRSAGEAAVYVPSGDDVAVARRIAELVRDPERRARMGAHGREQVRAHLAWDHQAPELLRAYERMLAR